MTGLHGKGCTERVKRLSNTEMNPKIRIACFISSHGFGHAARASAVMSAIYDYWPFVHFEIFTQTPEWFFTQSLKAPFSYHRVCTDIGMVQTSPFDFDLSQTIAALDLFFPFDEEHLATLADTIRAAGCKMIICDISPLGIAVGKQAEISSVLIENFTWDWIYEAYLERDHRLKRHMDDLGAVFAAADHRIRAAPVCGEGDGFLQTPPISRPHRTPRAKVRERLGLATGEKMVLITMGGIPEPVRFVDRLHKFQGNIHFVAQGASAGLPPGGTRNKNVTLLPHASRYYHPDLVHAADAVIGKLGYSTLAEAYAAGIPFGYVPRSDFRESNVLESYVSGRMSCIRIPEDGFQSGAWLQDLSRLMSLPVKTPGRINGAGAAAKYICTELARENEIIEVVDPEGRVVGAAPRGEVHGNSRLLHRVVHLLLFDHEGRLLLQKRSMDKDVAPGRWDTSVGGHVDCGESPDEALLRETREELGVSLSQPRFAYKYIHSNPYESELVFTYVCRFEGNITCNAGEIEAVRFWPFPEIEKQIGRGVLSDNFEDEFLRYRKWTARNP